MDKEKAKIKEVGKGEVGMDAESSRTGQREISKGTIEPHDLGRFIVR